MLPERASYHRPHDPLALPHSGAEDPARLATLLSSSIPSERYPAAPTTLHEFTTCTTYTARHDLDETWTTFMSSCAFLLDVLYKSVI